MGTTISRCLAPFLILVFAAGCGSTSKPIVTPIVTVRGKILSEGTPLPSYYTVTFLPDVVRGNVNPLAPSAKLKSGGGYELTAPSGWYKVILASSAASVPTDKAVKIDAKFLNPDETPWEIEVVDKPAPGVYDLNAGVVRSLAAAPAVTSSVPPPVNTEKPATKTPAPTTSTPPAYVPHAPPPPPPPFELVETPIISGLAMLCQAMALVVLLAMVVGAIGVLPISSRKFKKPKAEQNDEPVNEVRARQAPVSNSAPASPWPRVVLLIVGGMAVIGLLGAAEMMNLAARMEQKMDYLMRR